MMSDDHQQLEQNDTLEDDSNMADDENSTTVNNDESNGEAVINNADMTREESFISCINEDEECGGDQTMTNNTTTEDPFESFTANTETNAAETDDNNSIAVCNEIENGSQDANDAFQIQSIESINGKANDKDFNIEQNDTNSNDNTTTNSD